MTEYSFNNDSKSIDFVINELSHNPALSDWEDNFIKDIKEYCINKHGFLSDKQLQKLSDLWEKY
jgi:hypothetical protein